MKKTMKKLVALTLALVMVLGAAPIIGIDFSTQASAVTEGIYTYSVTDNKATITDCGYPASDSLTIPSTLGGYPVTSIGYAAFAHLYVLISVSIPAGVTSIGDDAFKFCSSLTSINIPASVTSIGDYAFYDCYSMTSVTFDEGSQLTSIGNSAFSSCTSLRNINIPTSVKSIGEEAFYSCDSLTSINIPSGVTSIGERTFYYCPSLTSITVDITNEYYSSDENGVLFNKDKTVLIQYPAVNRRTTYQVPMGVTSIGEYAFYLSKNLASICMPESVTNIGEFAFSGCEYLTSFTIPASVTSIGQYAFNYCHSLTSVNIPEGVTSISDDAFCGCSSLTSISLPSSLTSIGRGAFGSCTSLASINIPASVTIIGRSAFGSCSSLASFNIPESVTIIGKDAFYNTAYYNNAANWTGDVLYIDNCLINAKETISGSLVIAEGTRLISNGTFYACTSLSSVSIPEGVTRISDGVFWACLSLASVNIPEDVTSIGYGAFAGCAMTSINIPEGVTSIGEEAFGSCLSLTSINIPASVTSIGEKALMTAYEGDTTLSLMSINVDSANQYYSSDENGVLFNKDKTVLIQYPAGKTETEYLIPSSVKSIGEWAFIHCMSLTSVNIPESVTSIGIGAFGLCTSLTSVTFDEGSQLTSIGDYAFQDCTSLTSISIPSSMTSIGHYAFAGHTSLVYVHIPSSVTTIGEYLLAGTTAYICSDTATCYAKTYSDEQGYDFVVCDGHTIAVTGVTVTPTSQTLIVGGTQQLTAMVAPEDATNKDVTYASSNTAVATISASGLITAVSAGTATITVTTADGNKTATCAVTVIAPSVSIKNLNNSASINYGDTLKLTAITADLPAGAYVEWSVSGSGVEMVSQNKENKTCDVKSTGKGTATVTATVVDSNGNPILNNGNEINATQNLTSKAGFFQKLISFFKNLFGLNRIILQAFKQFM